MCYAELIKETSAKVRTGTGLEVGHSPCRFAAPGAQFRRRTAKQAAGFPAGTPASSRAPHRRPSAGGGGVCAPRRAARGPRGACSPGAREPRAAFCSHVARGGRLLRQLHEMQVSSSVSKGFPELAMLVHPRVSPPGAQAPLSPRAAPRLPPATPRCPCPRVTCATQSFTWPSPGLADTVSHSDTCVY